MSERDREETINPSTAEAHPFCLPIPGRPVVQRLAVSAPLQLAVRTDDVTGCHDKHPPRDVGSLEPTIVKIVRVPKVTAPVSLSVELRASGEPTSQLSHPVSVPQFPNLYSRCLVNETRHGQFLFGWGWIKQ